MKELIRLLRPQQWYKNLVIFLPIIFALQFSNTLALGKTALGFISLCLISSVTYIINDVADIEKDRHHPEKKNRPLASGKVGILTALMLSIFLLVGSVALAFWISVYFSYFVLLLFIASQLYTFVWKKQAFADVIAIAINFVIRAVSGTVVIVVNNGPWLKVSPWLILCPFFLSLFLSLAKRKADIITLGKNAAKHKEVLPFYTPQVTDALLIISTCLLLISYSLFSFLSSHPFLLLTLPPMLYFVFRYLYLIESGSIIARHPEIMYRDRGLVFSGLLTFIVAVAVLYGNVLW